MTNTDLIRVRLKNSLLAADEPLSQFGLKAGFSSPSAAAHTVKNFIAGRKPHGRTLSLIVGEMRRRGWLPADQMPQTGMAHALPTPEEPQPDPVTVPVLPEASVRLEQHYELSFEERCEVIAKLHPNTDLIRKLFPNL